MKENESDWNSLIKLGDMMGDGLHYETDGKWIAREYRALARKLMPEAFNHRKKLKAAIIDEQMSKLLSEKPCACGGQIKQTRSGSKSCKCTGCGQQYKARAK